MAYITFDFGSSNSGAILNLSGKNYQLDELVYIHKDDATGFTKQPTVFWIKRSLLEKSSISENDINIFSPVFYEDKYYASANFLWGKGQIKDKIPELSKNREWIYIQYPKMELYKRDNHSPANTLIKATDGSTFPFVKVLRIFFMVIKKECFHKASQVSFVLSANDIDWGITVPGLAIWHQEAREVFKDVADSVFGDNLTLYSEPECALVGVNLAGGDGNLDLVENRYSLVVDLGGGTADICVMKETLHEDGVTSFDEVKSTYEDKDSTTSERVGGNDIDRNFKSFICRYLAQHAGVKGEAISLFTDFFKENPKGAMLFDTQWHNLQFSKDIEAEKVDFNPEREYCVWLKTHYPNAAKLLEYGSFCLPGKELREYVFQPVYDVILRSVEENLEVLKRDRIDLDLVYFAGGLSLDKRLKGMIKELVRKYHPYARFKEASAGATIGAIQRGGNYIAVNKEALIRRMARKTFYTKYVEKYKGNEDDLRKILFVRLQEGYHKLGVRLDDSKINKILDEQWSNKSINRDGSVPYLSPICLRYTPVTQIESYVIEPFNKGKQKGMCVDVYSSDKNYVLFECSDVKCEEKLDHNFGYEWSEAKLTFDPKSNAVEGMALFYLSDEKGNKLKEVVIKNVSKRGF